MSLKPPKRDRTEKAKGRFVRYVYTDGATVTIQWETILTGDWPYGKDVYEKVIKKPFNFYPEDEAK